MNATTIRTLEARADARSIRELENAQIRELDAMMAEDDDLVAMVERARARRALVIGAQR
jgi:hypothetical protein